jgi:uncharacterized protein YgbK (DUF1537 family)
LTEAIRTVGPPFFVLADDLGGAAATGSLVSERLGVGSVICADLQRMLAGGAIPQGNWLCICINLGVRDAPVGTVVKALERARSLLVRDRPFALRIDGLLRGPVEPFIRYALRLASVLITDTIPELGRYTKKGIVYMGDRRLDLAAMVEKLSNKARRAGKEIIVADSESHEDLRRLARRCIAEGLLAIDPGPLIAHVVEEMSVKWKGGPL